MRFFYPDVFVTCSEADRQQPLYKNEPVLIVEVLSEGTAATKIIGFPKTRAARRGMLATEEANTKRTRPPPQAVFNRRPSCDKMLESRPTWS